MTTFRSGGPPPVADPAWRQLPPSSHPERFKNRKITLLLARHYWVTRIARIVQAHPSMSPFLVGGGQETVLVLHLANDWVTFPLSPSGESLLRGAIYPSSRSSMRSVMLPALTAAGRNAPKGCHHGIFHFLSRAPHGQLSAVSRLAKAPDTSTIFVCLWSLTGKAGSIQVHAFTSRGLVGLHCTRSRLRR